VETLNKWLVGLQGDMIVVGLPMNASRMSKEDALLLAAWLVALASNDPAQDFEPVLNAVLST
jgi:hypothetical protein